MDEAIEQDLREKALRGDASAAPLLISCFGESLLGYARAHAKDLSDADRETIVELAIEAGIRALPRFDPARGTLRGWFRGQIVYQTLAWRRAHPTIIAFDEQPATPPEPDPLPAAQIDALRRATQRLSRDDQTILDLRNNEQLDYAEIADRLQIPEATARQRHKRALAKLRVETAKEPELQHLKEAN